MVSSTDKKLYLFMTVNYNPFTFLFHSRGVPHLQVIALNKALKPSACANVFYTAVLIVSTANEDLCGRRTSTPLMSVVKEWKFIHGLTLGDCP